MPAHQYDGRPSEKEESTEITHSSVPPTAPTVDISPEPVQPLPNTVEEKRQDQSFGYGY